MKSIRILVLVSLTLALPALALPQEERARVVRAGTLIIDPLQAPIPNGVVVIRGDTIVAAGSVSEPPGAEIIDLREFTVLPGLIDAHTHLPVAPYWSANQPSPALGALRAAQGTTRALEAGVTTMRVVGTLHFQDVALRDAINEGTLIGPRVVPAGHALTIPGGHGDPYAFAHNLTLDEFYKPLFGFISSPEDAEKAIYLQVRHGAEVIKVSASGGVGSPLDYPSQQQISDEELRVIVDTAHRMGLRVTAHAESLPSILASLEAGIDSIDHGSELDEAAIQKMVTAGTFLIPTVHVVDRERGPSSSAFVREKAASIHDSHVAAFAAALAAGVKIAAGSDSPYTGAFTVIEELQSMVAHEMTPIQALYAATGAGAENLGLEDEIGSLSDGKKADLIAVRGNPLEEIEALESVFLVMRNGRVLIDRTTEP